MKLKRKAFNQCVLPNWSRDFNSYQNVSCEITNIKWKNLLGISLKDKARNGEIRKKTGMEDIVECIAKRKWKWAGHIARTSDDGWTKKILEWKSRADKRSRHDLPHDGPMT